MNNFVGLDTPNSKIMPYALNIVYIMNSEKTLVHTIQTIIPQTANCLSLNTVICRYDTVPWYVIWQSSIRRHTRHAAVWLSAKPTLHSTVITYISSVSISIIVKLDAFTLRHKMTKISSDQTPPLGDSKYYVTRLSSPHLSSLHLNSLLRWTNNNKHNDTINLHAQNCCTHKLHNQTHPKISQNVYKSKRNLVANDVHVSHTEFTTIIADQLMVGQLTQPINTIWAKSYAHDDSAIISHSRWQ